MADDPTPIDADDEEDLIPYFEEGIRLAVERGLANGGPIVVGSECVLYEVYPDGTRRKIGDLPPSIPVDKDRKYYIR